MDIDKIIYSLCQFLDDYYPEHGVTENIINEYKLSMQKNLFNKLEIVVYRDGASIIYDDLTGVITYFNNECDCIEVNTPINSSINDIYNKIKLICMELNLSKNP